MDKGRRLAWGVLLVVLTACGASERDQDGAGLLVAEQLLDAFYAWDVPTVRELTHPGPDADRLLYYQGWAEAAHYRVIERPPCVRNQSAVVCAVTVTDDFGSALGYTATDTFTMTVSGDKVSGVAFEGDDPPVFSELFAWLAETRPEVFEGPCRDMFDGGTTPGDCAREVARAAAVFADQVR